MADALVDQLAAYIAGYRLRVLPPAEMQRAALSAFPGSDASDYARALGLANRLRQERRVRD